MLGTHLRIVTKGLAIQYLFKWFLDRMAGADAEPIIDLPITETHCPLYATVLRYPLNIPL